MFILSLGALVAVVSAPALDLPIVGGPALAQTSSEEKDAFEAAKELGTVEAWDAFLSNYPTGFHADLARAYVKQLAAPAAPAQPPQAYQPPPPVANEFPVAAGSWGGIVRSGPGQEYRKITSLDEGDDVTLLERTGSVWNGFPWFKIAYGSGRNGYQWGGILCAKGTAVPGIFESCRASSSNNTTPTKTTSSKPKGCGSGKIRVDGKCMSKGQAIGYCGPGYAPRGGKCVFKHAQPKAPKCPPGQVWSAQELCHYDD